MYFYRGDNGEDEEDNVEARYDVRAWVLEHDVEALPLAEALLEEVGPAQAYH